MSLETRVDLLEESLKSVIKNQIHANKQREYIKDQLFYAIQTSGNKFTSLLFNQRQFIAESIEKAEIRLEQRFDERIDGLESKLDGVQSDVAGLKGDVNELKNDVAKILELLSK